MHTRLKWSQPWHRARQERAQKIQLLAMRQSPWVVDAHHNQSQQVTAHTPLRATVEGPRPLPHGVWNSEIWGVLEGHWCMPFDRTREYSESETRREILSQGNKPHTGCEVLYLLVRKCSRPKARSSAAKLGFNLWSFQTAHETAFLNSSATCSWKHSGCQHLRSEATPFDNPHGCCSSSSLKATCPPHPPCPAWRGFRGGLPFWVCAALFPLVPGVLPLPWPCPIHQTQGPFAQITPLRSHREML